MELEDLSTDEYFELYERIEKLFESRGIVLTNEEIESKMKEYLKRRKSDV